ncbi:thioesterase family protein [Comamonadaceae bacterium OH2545_COT-014]|nr:thioesterase family protein [Comamonadaceae bacterium OH2545_COT-014]
MTPHATARPDRPALDIASAFEPEFIEGVRRIFDEQIVFNRLLGLRLTALAPERAQARLDMREELIGHFEHRRVHGGVISAGLDAMGGAAVMAALGARHMDEPPAARLRRFSKLGTIDLRVDYLRPGTGTHFLLSAEVLRLGSRVANTRMAFHAADGRLLAAGSAAYIVS